MCVDNFNLISSLLDYTIPNTLYFVQILKRRKENPDMKTGTKVVNNYFLYNKSDLDKIKHLIVYDCKHHNARAYINLNRCDIEKVALKTISLIVENITQGQSDQVKHAYAKACGNCNNENTPKWIIDLDQEHLPFIDQIREAVNELHKEIEGTDNKLIAEIPTKNGVHFISNPFNRREYNKRMSDIFKGNITLPKVMNSSPTILFL